MRPPSPPADTPPARSATAATATATVVAAVTCADRVGGPTQVVAAFVADGPAWHHDRAATARKALEQLGTEAAQLGYRGVVAARVVPASDGMVAYGTAVDPPASHPVWGHSRG